MRLFKSLAPMFCSGSSSRYSLCSFTLVTSSVDGSGIMPQRLLKYETQQSVMTVTSQFLSLFALNLQYPTGLLLESADLLVNVAECSVGEMRSPAPFSLSPIDYRLL